MGDGASVSTVTLDDPEHGLTEEVLAQTDVLVWWGHAAHAEVSDEVVERVHRHVLEGMGLLVLHSGHWSKIFGKLMGTTCTLRWRSKDDREMGAFENWMLRLPIWPRESTSAASARGDGARAVGRHGGAPVRRSPTAA